jgi:hypothetical protein
MRAPLSYDAIYGWWRSAVARMPETVPDVPQCGFFKRRMVRGGIYVPCKIWIVQDIGPDGELLDDVTMLAEVNGDPADPEDIWSYVAGEPISEAEFKYLTARGEWAVRYAPNDPAANPRERIDALTSPIHF